VKEQDNLFPYGKFDGQVGGQPDDRILAVLNGVQNNMMMMLQKIDVLEYKVRQLEEKAND
jgi:hypothetical protein